MNLAEICKSRVKRVEAVSNHGLVSHRSGVTRTSSCRDVGLLLFDLAAVVVRDAAVRALPPRGP